MLKPVSILLLLGLVIGLPFLFRGKDGQFSDAIDETVVIITPHNEALRYEFTEGFREWYYKKTGKRVAIDWRIPGGTQDVVRYVDSTFTNAFRLYWERDLGKKWSISVSDAFERRASREEPKAGTLGYEVRQALLNSNVGCGIDLFFGGGKVDLDLQARKGQIVDSGIFEKHPGWFVDSVIPQYFGGNNFWEEKKRWVGTALSGFGIIYNKEVVEDFGIEKELSQWEDLTQDALFGEVALTDPTASGAFTMAFEIILQQQMQNELRRLLDEGLAEGAQTEAQAVTSGWMKGMQLIQKISANARYFTDRATKPVLDVSAGDCAVGMAIDFYGLFQEENLRNRSGSQRFNFVMPKGGSVVSPDPIAMFRGAPNPELALAFIEYVLSIDGQKLWDYRVGTPGGPKQYALSRAPIRKELYEGEYLKYRGNPTLNLYKDVAGFTYHQEWTAFLFKELRFSIKAAFVDSHKELVDAWSSIIRARKEGRDEAAKLALKLMESLGDISYEAVKGSIKDTLNSGDPLDEIKLQSSLVRKFRQQYREVKRLAEGVRES